MSSIALIVSQFGAYSCNALCSQRNQFGTIVSGWSHLQIVPSCTRFHLFDLCAQNMSGANFVRVIRKDTKFFWRARCTVDIDIVEHNAVDTVELICYESTTNQHAMRMYFNRTILLERLDVDELEEKLRFAKEPFLRRHESPPEEEVLCASIRDDALVDYLTNRLTVAEYSPTSFSMSFEPKAFDLKNGGVGGTDVSHLMCDKPAKLIPFDPELFHPLK